MTTILEDFYESYLHYSVAQRLFEDTCRQLTQCKGTVDERQALVDETLRLATCVSDNIDDTESLIADTIEYLQAEGGDSDLLEAISLITNNLKEDRARADNYSLFVTARRTGNTTRRPRKPQVANPFEYVPGDGFEESAEETEVTESEESDDTVEEESEEESEEGSSEGGSDTVTEEEDQAEDEDAVEETSEETSEGKKKKKIWRRK